MNVNKMYSNHEFEIDLLDLLKSLKRNIFYIFVVSIIAMIIGFGISLLHANPNYICTTTISIVPIQGTNSNLQNINNYMEILQSDEIKNLVIKDVGIDSLEELNEALTIDNPENTSLIQISANTGNKKMSTDIINKLISNFEAETEETLGVTVDTITNLAINEVRSSFTIPKMVCLGFVSGFFISCLFFIVKYFFSGYFHTLNQVESYLALPVLVKIPYISEEKERLL